MGLVLGLISGRISGSLVVVAAGSVELGLVVYLGASWALGARDLRAVWWLVQGEKGD